MKKAGEELKSIREEKGYSMLEVSKNTKISASVLRALEEGRIDNIDPIYLKGFIKIYCRFLGLKWEDFLKEHPLPSEAKHAHRQASTAQEPKEPSAKSHAQKVFSPSAFILKNKKIIIISLLSIAALLFVMLVLRGCVFVLKKFASRVVAQKTAVVQPKKPSKTVSKQTPSTKTQTPRQDTQSSPAQALTPAVKEQKPKEITLVIRAQENSFLTVRVDGKLVYQRMLSKGKAENWIAKEKIELSVGNAGGVTLEINGKVFSSLGRRGQAIKNIVITHEGLKIL